MAVRFSAINVLNPQSPDYVKVDVRVRDNVTGREMVLTKVEVNADPLFIRVLGGPRVNLSGRVVVPSSRTLDEELLSRLDEDVRGLIQEAPGSTASYMLPLDDPDG